MEGRIQTKASNFSEVNLPHSLHNHHLNLDRQESVDPTYASPIQESILTVSVQTLIPPKLVEFLAPVY